MPHESDLTFGSTGVTMPKMHMALLGWHTMKVGYARTSTIEQVAGLEAQHRDLKAVGIDKLFSEQLSSVDAKRPELENALEFVREGDVLMVTKLDRLARSVADLVSIEATLAAKGASLVILDPAIDTTSPIGRLVFNMMASIAQFEREVMLTRQREGIAKAKREGKYTGRQPTARAKAGEVIKLHKDGLKAPEIARKLEISVRSVFRVLADGSSS